MEKLPCSSNVESEMSGIRIFTSVSECPVRCSFEIISLESSRFIAPKSSSSQKEAPSLSRKDSRPFFDDKNEILSLSRSNVVSEELRCSWNDECRSTECRLLDSPT